MFKIIFYICTVLKEKIFVYTLSLYCVGMTVVISCLLSPDGGIGRRAGLKHLWETVPVRLRLRVQKPLQFEEVFLVLEGFYFFK